MRWQKLGHIFTASGDISWSRSHAQVPIVDVLDEERWHVYYATRDEAGLSRIARLTLNAQKPTQVLAHDPKPILALGALGAFDDCGVMPTSVLHHEGKILLYYIGWTQRRTVPYQNAVGLAVSHDGGKTFERYAAGPIFGLLPHEPYFCGTAWVCKEGERFRCWYLSCVGWDDDGAQPEPRYHLKYAESEDGIVWRRDGHVAVDFAHDEEGGLASATVLRRGASYSMWFCCRGRKDYRSPGVHSYRVGFARSTDGLSWERDDASAGIECSAAGWDSEMIAYPCVFQAGGETYMLYNGNGFGKSGFGLAQQEAVL